MINHSIYQAKNDFIMAIRSNLTREENGIFDRLLMAIASTSNLKELNTHKSFYVNADYLTLEMWEKISNHTLICKNGRFHLFTSFWKFAGQSLLGVTDTFFHKIVDSDKDFKAFIQKEIEG